jgi:hypothetical protein
MSSSGTSTRSAARYLAASTANTQLNSSDAAERDEHAQRRAQQVVRQHPRVERERQRVAELVGPRHLRSAVAEQHQRAPARAAAAPSPSDWCRHRRSGGGRIRCSSAWRSACARR